MKVTNNLANKNPTAVLGGRRISSQCNRKDLCVCVRVHMSKQCTILRIFCDHNYQASQKHDVPAKKYI